MHKDSKDYCSVCDVHHRMGQSSRRDELPINPYISLQAFDNVK